MVDIRELQGMKGRDLRDVKGFFRTLHLLGLEDKDIESLLSFVREFPSCKEKVERMEQEQRNISVRLQNQEKREAEEIRNRTFKATGAGNPVRGFDL